MDAVISDFNIVFVICLGIVSCILVILMRFRIFNQWEVVFSNQMVNKYKFTLSLRHLRHICFVKFLKKKRPEYPVAREIPKVTSSQVK